jgi:hypothetical protein
VSVKLTPKQKLVLWNLLISDEELMMSKVKPELKPIERKPLVDEDLIQLEKRGSANYVVLTDKAWDWAIENFNAEFPAKAIAAVPVLQKLLVKLGVHLQAHNLSLAEFLRPQDKTGVKLEAKVRAAYAKISGDRYNVRVRLSELRPHLSDCPRADIDQSINEMELSGKLVLMPLDDPQETYPADEEAAIDIGGSKRHILYMKG